MEDTKTSIVRLTARKLAEVKRSSLDGAHIPVPLKYGKLATKYLWIYMDIFYSVELECTSWY